MKRPGIVLASALLLCATRAEAGQLNVTIAPASGEAMIITYGDFMTCEMRRVDPWNPRRCSHWRSLRIGRTNGMSGRYCIMAIWANGQTHRGALRIRVGSRPLHYAIAPTPAATASACR